MTQLQYSTTPSKAARIFDPRIPEYILNHPNAQTPYHRTPRLSGNRPRGTPSFQFQRAARVVRLQISRGRSVKSKIIIIGVVPPGDAPEENVPMKGEEPFVYDVRA